MALSSELAERLEAGEPLRKRLKLAENAYCSTDLAITGKRDTIVEWLCRVAPTDLVAWKTLSLCIHCHGSNNRTCLTNETVRILIETLMEKLKLRDEPLGEEVMDLCNRVLSDPELRQYFNTRLNKLCLFIRTLFIRIKSDGDYERGGDRENLVLNSVEDLVQIHKQHSEKDELAEDFMNYVLGPLCALVDPTCKDNTNRIGAEAHKCVQQILFAKGRYKEYKDYSQGRIEEGSLPAKFFPAISRLVHGMDSDDVVAMLSCLFGAAVASYKGDSTLVDVFFRGLVDAAGDFKTDVSNSLMEYLADIPLDYENKIDDISLTDYLGNLIDESIVREGFSAVEYSLLGNIARLNPLVVENRLPNIFKRILLAKRESEFEVRSYDRLMISILNASSKLRREQKLIPWLLLALESALGENKDCRLTAAQILPVDFCCKFTALVCGLQSPQITAMLRSLNFHFKSNCVEEYEKGSRNQVRLMTECTGSLLVSFFNGIHVYEHTVPLALQQKFVAALGELGELLSALGGKLVKATKPDRRIIVVLFQAVLSWVEVQSLLEFYAPDSNAGDLPCPISVNNLKKLIPIVESLGENRCTNAANKFLLRRIQLDPKRREPRKKLTGMIGGLEASWRIIIQDYPSLVSLLDFDQLSQLASLILEEVVADESGFDKWGDLLEREVLQEDEKFNAAILCHAFTKIGTVIKDCCATAAIISRIDLIEILKNETKDAALLSLDRRRPITDVVQWLDLSSDESTKIQKCLMILYRLPLIYFGAELRTMVFVTTYVISREFKSEEGIASLCDKILFDTLEEGGINVFHFIDPTSLMSCLPGSKVLEKVFAMSLRNAGDFSQEDLAALENCPEEAIPTVLSCIENAKSKLSNERKRALGEVEKKLGKKALSNAKKNSESVEKTRGLTQALRVAVGNNNVKGQLKKSISSTLRFIFMENDDDEENKSPDDNRKSNNNTELIRQGFELAAIALQHRTRFDFPEKLYNGIWEMVFEYPQAALLPQLLEATPPRLLQLILGCLHSRTERDLREKDIAKLSNTLSIWNSIIRSDMALARSKSRLDATCKLLQSLHVMEIGAENWPDLIKLLSTIVNAKHMQLTGNNIDMIVLTGCKSLREGDLTVYDDVLALCLALLRSRSEMMTDRLPIFLQLYRQAIVLIIREANKENATDRHRLALSALSVEKVSSALVKLKRDVARVSPYVIADLVNDFGGSELQPALKQSFTNSLNTLLSICDRYGVNLLLRALPTSKREIFKDLNDNYNKYHKFEGKI